MRTAWLVSGLLACLMPLLAAEAEPRLFEAAKRNDVAAIRALIDGKANVNEASADGTTALHWAAHHDNPEAAKVLIGAGANVSAVNRYGIAPISMAATNGSADMLTLLLDAGADANAATPEGETVLMTAARSGKLAAVNVLLARRADVNRKENWRGQTALMWAAAEGHAGVVEQLLESGADPKIRSNGGFSAFLFAVREGKADVVRKLLAAGADANDTLPLSSRRPRGGGEGEGSRAGSSALHIAVANAHYEVAAMLLDAGANPNASGPGWTPLHTITWVRKPGAASNDPAPPGSGKMSSLDFVRKLARSGANLNARMTQRTSAGLSVMNMIGATPFLMAARTADAELMRLLAELGADPLLTNQDKSTPLMIAAGLGTRSPGEDAGTEAEVLEAVKVALELGNDPNAVDNRGETAMHGAAYKHLPAVARYLAERGAKIEVWNQKNKAGWTPLRIAAGVHRTGNFRFSEETAAAIRDIMTKAGVAVVLEPEPAVSAGR